MDEPEKSFPLERYDRIWPGRWRDGQVLLLLLLLALGIRAWVVWQTEVPARDSIGFIRYALQFETSDWRTVFYESYQHPGYPLAILTVSWPVRWFTGPADCYNMQLSAQIASSLAGLLLVIPMFYLGKHLFGRAVGFWSALLFQCLPGSGQVLSDAISDPMFLCLVTTALLFGVRAVQGNSPRLFALCGLFSGLSYLVRPEGALAVVTVGLVLLGMQLLPHCRRRWKNFLACGSALALAALLAGSPYFLVTGSFTNKPSAQQLTGQLAAQGESTPASSMGGPLFAVTISKKVAPPMRYWLGIKAIGAEFAHAYQYVGWLPALLAVWWCRDRFRAVVGSWVLLLLFGMHALLVWWLAVKAGYVSDRHVLLLVLISIFQAVAGTMQLPFRAADWFRARAARRADNAVPLPQNLSAPGIMTTTGNNFPTRYLLPAASWSLLFLFLLIGAGLTKTLRPLHGHRAGHHKAGQWLAEHSQPLDLIEDDHCWAHYYAGRVFLEFAPPVPAGYNPATYIVFSRASDRREPTTRRKYDEKELISRGARVVYQWPERVRGERAKVLVYQLP